MDLRDAHHLRRAPAEESWHFHDAAVAQIA
jgi:hypothetical protein